MFKSILHVNENFIIAVGSETHGLALQRALVSVSKPHTK
jgi:hypothetical protein